MKKSFSVLVHLISLFYFTKMISFEYMRNNNQVLVFKGFKPVRPFEKVFQFLMSAHQYAQSSEI